MSTASRLALLVALVAPALGVAAPCPAHGEPGGRVRVTILARASVDSLALRGIEPGDRIVGTLLAADPHRIALRRGEDLGDTLAIPRSLIAGFETSTGRHSRAGRGALIGFLAGAVAGVGFGLYFESSEGTSSSAWPGPNFIPFAFGVGGAIGGLGLGALVGSFFHTDRWRPAVLPQEGSPTDGRSSR